MTECRHRLRVMGARELVRKRVRAGWLDPSATKGVVLACTVCLRDFRGAAVGEDEKR